MAIKRWDPVRNIREMQTRMNELFDSALAGSAGTGAAESMTNGWTPPMDLFEEHNKTCVARVERHAIVVTPHFTIDDLHWQHYD